MLDFHWNASLLPLVIFLRKYIKFTLYRGVHLVSKVAEKFQINLKRSEIKIDFKDKDFSRKSDFPLSLYTRQKRRIQKQCLWNKFMRFLVGKFEKVATFLRDRDSSLHFPKITITRLCSEWSKLSIFDRQLRRFLNKIVASGNNQQFVPIVLTYLSFKELRSMSLARGISWCLLGKSKVDCPSLKWRASRSCRDSSSDITARLLVRFKSFLRSCVDCAEFASCRPPSLQFHQN